VAESPFAKTSSVATFGILKGRWRILKTGVRLAGVHAADSIFMTCCALHNWLLFVDGLDACWEDGMPSDWEVNWAK
jgi:hypothetical protein